jgi:hypothetical protein
MFILLILKLLIKKQYFKVYRQILKNIISNLYIDLKTAKEEVENFDTVLYNTKI